MSILIKSSIAQNIRKLISSRKYIQYTKIWNKQNYSQKSNSLAPTTRDDGSNNRNLPGAPQLGEKIKENTKTATYMGIIVLGVSVTGIMFFAILRELFSSNSPNNVYTKALDVVANDPRVQDALGAPIKGYGEGHRSRRRHRVAHTLYEKNGVNYMRMQFNVQGIRNKATAHLEMKQNSSGTYIYRYLFVQLDHYPRTTIILEDNRAIQEESFNINNNTLQLQQQIE